MPSQIEKLRAYAAHLLDEMIHLREKYALLEPMIFDKELTGSWSRGRRARGFQTLRTALVYSCAQDIAKIAFDGYRRVPSIINLIAPIQDDHLRAQFREDYSVIKYHLEEDDSRDPAVLRALRRMEEKETATRREQFDALYEELQKEWDQLRKSVALQAFLTIRDKITAHSEVRHREEEYIRVDVATLGLKWEDLRKAIDQLQRLVDKLNLLLRGASFAWGMLDDQLTEASQSFWRAPPPQAPAVDN